MQSSLFPRSHHLPIAKFLSDDQIDMSGFPGGHRLCRSNSLLGYVTVSGPRPKRAEAV